MSKFDKFGNFIKCIIKLLLDTLLLFYSIYGIAQNIIGVENAPSIWLCVFWLLGFVASMMRRN